MRRTIAAHGRNRMFVSTGMLAMVVLLASSLAPACARANLLTNGSFETGPDPVTTMTLAAGSTVVPGWVATRAGVEYVSTLWTAASGYRSIALNAANAGGIAQTFASLPHARYNVRFYLAGDPDSTPLIKTMTVAAAHQSGNFTADITGMWAWDPGWNPHNWSFLAESTSTTIEFYSTMTGATGATLDSVSVELVSVAGVDGEAAGLRFAAPYPNPARGAAHLAFTLPQAAHVRLTVYDLAGRAVRTLLDASLPAGARSLDWDGRIGASAAPPGLYHVELLAGTTRIVRPLVHLE